MKRTIMRTVLYCAFLAGLESQELTGEIALKSFLHTYPDKVRAVTFTGEDWTIQVGGSLFYWAEGKLLPPEFRLNQEAYQSHSFSAYPAAIPDPRGYSPAEIDALQNRGNREAQPDTEDPYMGFQAALYGGSNREEIESRQVKTVFLGKTVVIHEDIAEALSRTEQRILNLAGEDPAIAEFVASIDVIGGYNWRPIQGTQRRSYHSWGMALDIQPKRLGNKVMYWFWERIFNREWMLVPLENRWMPPAGVIQAFEYEGFIWGGRWTLYDNMHFEYRPELLEANRLLASQSPETQPRRAPDAPNLHHIYPLTRRPQAPFWETVLIYLGLKKYFF
jgi:hypothetical protein